MMREVIIISQGKETTGVNKYAINLHSSFPEESKIYFLKFRNEHGPYSRGIPVEGKFPYGKSSFNLNSIFYRKAFQELAEMLKERKKDGSILHVSSPHVLPVAPGYDNIVTIHDVFPLLKGVEKSFEERMLQKFYMHYLKYDRIITVSRHVKKMLEGMGVDAKIDYICPYISDNFHPLENKSAIRKLLNLPDKKLILSISTNIPRKNLKVLPEIMDKLGPEYSLIRVGESIPNSITMRVENEVDLNMIYNACDILISPSIDEGFGYPVAEGLKAGINMVLSDIPVHREVAGTFAEYFEPLEAVSAVRSIREIESKDRPPENELLKMKEKFSIENFKINMTKYYNE